MPHLLRLPLGENMVKFKLEYNVQQATYIYRLLQTPYQERPNVSKSSDLNWDPARQ
jgi:hypothetical protein